MFERTIDLPVFYVPAGEIGYEEAYQRAGRWLRDQPGSSLVLVEVLSSYHHDELLQRETAGAVVTKPHRRAPEWTGGPVLVPWASEAVLDELTGVLRRRATAVCLIEWGDDPLERAWLSAHQAVNVVDGTMYEADEPGLHPVVVRAMQRLSERMNHNNGLGEPDKSWAVRTVETLRDGGYELDADELCAWALAHGFTERSVKKLRDFTEGVQAGRRFQLRFMSGPNAETLAEWEAAAGKS